MLIRQDTHKTFPGIVKSNAKLYNFLWKQVGTWKRCNGDLLNALLQLESYASRPENGYERLELLGDSEPVKEKTKAKARAPRRQKKEKASGFQIEFDHRMDIDPSASSSSHVQDRSKRSFDAQVNSEYGESSPKRRKPISSQGPSEIYGISC
jgi:hypothetical protein